MSTVDDWIGLSVSREAKPGIAPKDNWPLMGDILSHRAGVPEHLIQWRRAEGEADPKPTR